MTFINYLRWGITHMHGRAISSRALSVGQHYKTKYFMAALKMVRVGELKIRPLRIAPSFFCVLVSLSIRI